MRWGRRWGRVHCRTKERVYCRDVGYDGKRVGWSGWLVVGGGLHGKTYTRYGTLTKTA